MIGRPKAGSEFGECEVLRYVKMVGEVGSPGGLRLEWCRRSERVLEERVCKLSRSWLVESALLCRFSWEISLGQRRRGSRLCRSRL